VIVKTKTLKELLIESTTADALLSESMPDKRMIRRNDRNFVQFLLVWPEVKTALNDGWSLSRIWRVLSNQGKIGIGYKGFSYHIRKQQKKESRQIRRLENEESPSQKGLSPSASVEKPKNGEQSKKDPWAGKPNVDVTQLDVKGKMDTFGFKPGDPRRNVKW
jgi:hypothetical protein